MDIQKIFFR